MKKLLGIAALCLVLFFSGCAANGPMPSGQTTPRAQHYIFAHRAMRDFIFMDQENSLKTLNQDGQRFIDNLWDDIGNYAESQGEKRIPKDGLELSVASAADPKIYVVTLPKPERMTEAYFIAIVVKKGQVSYYALEKTFGPNFDLSKDATMLCGWTNEKVHLNFGLGPKPDRDDFIKAVMAGPQSKL